MNTTPAATSLSSATFYTYDYDTTNYSLATLDYKNFAYPTNDSYVGKL